MQGIASGQGLDFVQARADRPVTAILCYGELTFPMVNNSLTRPNARWERTMIEILQVAILLATSIGAALTGIAAIMKVRYWGKAHLLRAQRGDPDPALNHIVVRSDVDSQFVILRQAQDDRKA